MKLSLYTEEAQLPSSLSYPRVVVVRAWRPNRPSSFRQFKFIWDIGLHQTSCFRHWFLEHICLNSPNKKNISLWMEIYWVNLFKESKRLDWRMFIHWERCPVLFLVATNQSLISCATLSPGPLRGTGKNRKMTESALESEVWVWSRSYYTWAWAWESIILPTSQLLHL